ncbi:hypothetical protein SteCoe_34248 [Stentor coeruleus]|uniref:Uncharacterized protein n=1 Tax=Stentor coeruleus TaxID=5963 RepID=A0A1R2AUX4_9CILI|nr:hypothetical protein SteCoe_34248 [Stentor coeruleus]
MEDTLKDSHKDRVERSLEENFLGLIEDRKKDSLENNMEYSSENRKEDSHEDRIKNSPEARKQDEIKERIDISHEGKINDPLEEKMKTIQELEEFSENFPEIEFGISDEELCNRLLDPVEGLYLSVFYITIKKKEKFCYQNLYIFILCLENLIKFNLVSHDIVESEIEILIRKIYFFAFKAIENEVDFKTHANELDNCIKLFRSFLNHYLDLIVDFNGKYAILNNLVFCILIINKILEETSLLKNDFTYFFSWKLTIIQSLKLIENFDDYQEICLSDSTCVLLTNHINNLFRNTEKYDDIIRFMSSMLRPVVLDQVLALALKIDKKLFKLLIQKIKNNQETQDLKAIRKSITQSGKSLINQYKCNYRITPSQTLPNIQELLCLGLYNLVKISLDNGFKEDFVYYYKKYGKQENFSLCSLIRHIDQLPEQIQYFIAEILAKLRKTEVNWFYFVIEKVQKNLRFEIISQEWATDFIQLASSPPYCNILNKFKQDQNTDLKVILERITPKIILMELPEKNYGRTFYNNSIVLKLFFENEGSKGATFVIYLHELAHYLQRSQSDTIGASESPKSEKKFGVREGGYLIEREIFGSCLYYITVEAANYIVSLQVDQDHGQFLNVFTEKNKLTIEDDEIIEGKKIISLHRSSDKILLGECGSKFSNIRRKPNKN